MSTVATLPVTRLKETLSREEIPTLVYNNQTIVSNDNAAPHDTKKETM